MPVQKHLFLLDPLAKLNLQLDSSLRLAQALAQRGHNVWLTHAENLSWSSQSKSSTAMAAPLGFSSGVVTRPEVGNYQPRQLADFTAIHMRKDPPFDLDYISCTWLLDVAQTRVFNAPEALRSINEKLAILHYPKFARAALVSSEAEAILNFIITECQGDAILKPLELFGGRGVRRIQVEKQTEVELKRLLHEETAAGKHIRLVQKFDNAVFAGEVRAFAAFGEPLAWCLKVPANGNYLANTAAGAQLAPYSPSAKEIDTVREAAQALLGRGVALVGFDLIGGYISEMNITSPRLLVAPGDSTDYYGILAERFIAHLS